jgi:hypothetical protein
MYSLVALQMEGTFAIMSGVMAAPPDPGRTQEPSRVERGVLFIDDINSTRLFHDLGDERGRGVARIAFDFARCVKIGAPNSSASTSALGRRSRGSFA